MQALGVLHISLVLIIHLLYLRVNQIFKEPLFLHFLHPNRQAPRHRRSHVAIGLEYVVSEELADLVSVDLLRHEYSLKSLYELGKDLKDTLL